MTLVPDNAIIGPRRAASLIRSAVLTGMPVIGLDAARDLSLTACVLCRLAHRHTGGHCLPRGNLAVRQTNHVTDDAAFGSLSNS